MAKEKKTFKQKAENFWFYYKFHTLIILFVVAGTIYPIILMLTAPKPDYKILIAAKQLSTEVSIDTLKEELLKYGKDVNGDGKITIEITNCITNEDKQNLISASAYSTQLLTSLEKGTQIIYILDEARCEYVQEYLKELRADNPFIYFSNGENKVNLENTEFLKNSSSGVKKSLYFLIRDPKGTYLEKEKDINNQVEGAKQLVENICK